MNQLNDSIINISKSTKIVLKIEKSHPEFILLDKILVGIINVKKLN